MPRLEEDHFFFDCDGRRLYGFLHAPGGFGPAAPAGLVFLDPWGEEKVRNHRLLVNLARELAGRGHPVLRFDFYGYGDSAGTYEEAVLETMVADTRAAICLLRERTGVPRVGLFGPRFGGAVALESALANGTVDFLILLDPVLDASAYFYKLLRSNLSSQMLVHERVIRDRAQLVADLEQGESVNIDGYLLGSAFYRSIRDLAFFDDPRLADGLPPTLLLEVSKREAGQSQRPERLLDRLAGASARPALVSVDHPLLWEGQKVYCPHPAGIVEPIAGWLAGLNSS